VGLPTPIKPAALVLKNGAAFNLEYGDTYRSLAGALDETHHVFLSGNDLPKRWESQDAFTILETGFGTGLNFLATWRMWDEHLKNAGLNSKTARLHYIAVDKHPFQPKDLAHLHLHWPELAAYSAALLKRYPPLVPGFHRIHLDDAFENLPVSLTLLWGDATDMLKQLSAKVDAFFLDGFSPSCNPDMWNAPLFKQVARLAKADATCASFTVSGEVKRGLVAVGFDIEKRAGFGNKREMLTARYNNRYNLRTKLPLPERPETEKRAIIIGSGIAGALCAERLAARGWKLDVIERNNEPASEASGNPAGVLQPAPSTDWSRLNRITLAGFHYALRQLADLDDAKLGLIWHQCGVLRLARHAEDEVRQQRVVDTGIYPTEVLRRVDVAEASKLAGCAMPTSGWWFEQGGWLDPTTLCRAALDKASSRALLHTSRNVSEITQHENSWRALDEKGNVIAEAPVIILANGRLACDLKLTAWLPLRPVRGQLTYVPASLNYAEKTLNTVISREGYITPKTAAGFHVLGATYEENNTDTTVNEAGHRINLDRLKHLVPSFTTPLNAANVSNASTVSGRAGIRSVGPDRLPYVGAIPHATDNATAIHGLYGLLGLGSRGLVLAPLMAELLACQLNNEPLPVEIALVKALAFERLCKEAL